MIYIYIFLNLIKFDKTKTISIEKDCENFIEFFNSTGTVFNWISYAIKSIYMLFYNLCFIIHQNLFTENLITWIIWIQIHNSILREIFHLYSINNTNSINHTASLYLSYLFIHWWPFSSTFFFLCFWHSLKKKTKVDTKEKLFLYKQNLNRSIDQLGYLTFFTLKYFKVSYISTLVLIICFLI